jgi:uncharacterized membrane protein YbhN (UPF0104 family)
MSVASMGTEQSNRSPSAPAALDQAVAPDGDARRLRNGVLWTAGLALLCLSVALAVPDLRDVLDRATHVRLGWLIVALALEVGSCLGYVAVVRLVLHRGPKREVRRLAWAEMAFGAVVPLGGAGGLAVGAWAMRAWGIGWERVANRSAVIFLLTSAFNAAVLALSGAGVLAGVGTHRDGFLYGALPLVAGVGSIALFAVLPWLTGRRVPWLRARRGWGGAERMAGWVSDTEAVIAGGNVRLLGSVAYLLLDIAALWACLRAVGETPPVVALVAGYQIGYLSNLIPIPGAIGVLDGGLLGALVLYGLPAAPTATAVIVYHAVALWLPTAGGTAGFVGLRRALTQRVAPENRPPADSRQQTA